MYLDHCFSFSPLFFIFVFKCSCIRTVFAYEEYYYRFSLRRSWGQHQERKGRVPSRNKEMRKIGKSRGPLSSFLAGLVFSRLSHFLVYVYCTITLVSCIWNTARAPALRYTRQIEILRKWPCCCASFALSHSPLLPFSLIACLSSFSLFSRKLCLMF